MDNKLTNIYKDLIPSMTNNKFELIGEFNEDYITIKCNDCGTASKVKTDDFLKNPKCTYYNCIHREDMVNQIKEIVGDEYTVLKNFYTLDRKSKDFKKILIRHNKCGNIYSVVPRNFIKGRRCPECTKTQFKTHEEYVEDVNRVGKGKFKVLSPYTRASEKIWLEHSGGCKEKFEVNAGYFLRDPRCPLCEKQHLEKSDDNIQKG